MDRKKKTQQSPPLQEKKKKSQVNPLKANKLQPEQTVKNNETKKTPQGTPPKEASKFLKSSSVCSRKDNTKQVGTRKAIAFKLPPPPQHAKNNKQRTLLSFISNRFKPLQPIENNKQRTPPKKTDVKAEYQEVVLPTTSRAASVIKKSSDQNKIEKELSRLKDYIDAKNQKGGKKYTNTQIVEKFLNAFMAETHPIFNKSMEMKTFSEVTFFTDDVERSEHPMVQRYHALGRITGLYRKYSGLNEKMQAFFREELHGLITAVNRGLTKYCILYDFEGGTGNESNEELKKIAFQLIGKIKLIFEYMTGNEKKILMSKEQYILEEDIKGELKAEIDKLKKEKDQLIKDIDDESLKAPLLLENEELKLLIEKYDMNEKLGKQAELEAENKNLKEQLQAIGIEKEKLLIENDELKTENNSLKEEQKTIIEKNDELMRENGMLTQVQEGLKKRLEEEILKNQVLERTKKENKNKLWGIQTELENKKQELEEALKDLEKEKAKNEKDLKEQLDKKEKLTSKIEQLEEEEIQEILELKAENKNLEEQLQEKRIEREKEKELEEKIFEEKNIKIEELEKQLIDAKTAEDNALLSASEEKEKLTGLKEKLQKIEQELEGKSKANDEKEIELKKLREENENLKKQPEEENPKKEQVANNEKEIQTETEKTESRKIIISPRVKSISGKLFKLEKRHNQLMEALSELGKIKLEEKDESKQKIQKIILEEITKAQEDLERIGINVKLHTKNFQKRFINKENNNNREVISR